MLNLESIRKLNRVSLHYAPKDGVVQPFFMAYLKEGYSYGTSVLTEDAFGGVQSLIKNAAVMSVVDEVLKNAKKPVSAVLDLQRKMTYVGSNPATFNIQCSLYVINDFDKDVVQPIDNLQAYLLPKSSEQYNTKQIFDTAFNFLKSGQDKAINDHKDSNPNYTGGLWELAQGGLNMLNKFLGEVSLMERPLQFSDSSKSVVLKLPGLVVPQVFLKSVSYQIPYVTYTDTQGQPFIDRVDLTIEIETMRNVSRNYMQFLR